MYILIPDEYRKPFCFVTSLCLLISDKKQQEIEIALTNWNNNLGVEYSMLQAVFPKEIPLTLDAQNPPDTPVVNFIATQPQIVHFLLTAISVDAYFTMKWVEQEISLIVFDSQMEFRCGEKMQKLIDDFCVKEYGLTVDDNPFR